MVNINSQHVIICTDIFTVVDGSQAQLLLECIQMLNLLCWPICH